MTLKVAAGRNPDRVRRILAACESFEDVRRMGILFHGTCEEIDGDPKGGPYDQVFWTADSPAVAQAYIPRAGLRTWISEPRDVYDRAEHLRPTKYKSHAMQWALERAGVTVEDLDITWNGMSAWSWRIPPGWPTHGDYDDYIRSLGYKASSNGQYDVSETFTKDGRIQIMPADWRMPGQLLVVLAEGLDLREADWSEDALGYSNHNRVGDFQTFAERGLDGFRMEDVLQSDHHGNVGHEAIGLLPSGLEKISWLAIPAVRNDGEDFSVFSNSETPEFLAFMKELSPGYRSKVDLEAEAASMAPSP